VLPRLQQLLQRTLGGRVPTPLVGRLRGAPRERDELAQEFAESYPAAVNLLLIYSGAWLNAMANAPA